MRPDFKEWAAAHDAEPDKHDRELRTWVYEEKVPSDNPVPYTMKYKAKTNQFGALRNTKKKVPLEVTS